MISVNLCGFSVENMEFLVQTHTPQGFATTFACSIVLPLLSTQTWRVPPKKQFTSTKYHTIDWVLPVKMFWNLFCFMIIRSILFSYACAIDCVRVFVFTEHCSVTTSHCLICEASNGIFFAKSLINKSNNYEHKISCCENCFH